jgi:hypothetical protein
MKLMLVRHLWGVDLTHGFAQYLPHWCEVGYEAVEVSLRHVPDRAGFLHFLQEASLRWVPQVFSRDFQPGGTVREHLDSLRQQVEECLAYEPLFFNAHGGADTWSPTEAEEFYGQAIELETEIGVPIAHETHRQRYFATPWQTRHILQQFPALRLTCDLSHWVCVCERLLPDLGETISLAARHCHHVHARVGFAEGPQVPDPSAPEYAAELAAHERWWGEIWRSQAERGFTASTLTPEFGPPPYMHTLPHTNAPVADLAAVCDWMAKRQLDRFAGCGRADSGIGEKRPK